MRLILLLATVLALLSGLRPASAADALDDLIAAAPDGVSATVLMRSAIDWPKTPTGGGWATSIGFQRYRLEPEESVEVRSYDNAGPGSDVMLFAQGALTLVDERGAERPFREGATFAVDRRQATNPEYVFTVRNDGDRCAVFLRLSTNSCYQCGGGAILNAVPPVGPTRSFRCDEPLKAPRLFGLGTTPTISFVLRVTLESGAEWDFGDRLKRVIVAVEDGELVLDGHGDSAQALRTGDVAEVAEWAPHRVRNRGERPASFLIVGSADSHGGHGVLELRRIECPPGAQRPYRVSCERGPTTVTPIRLSGPSGFEAFQVAEPIASPGGATSANIAIFRGLVGGRYTASDIAAPPDAEAFVSCFEGDSEGFGGDSPIAEFSGPATEGFDIDLPDGVHAVCYWYSGVS